MWKLVAIGVVVSLFVAAIALVGGSYWWFSAKVGAANQRTGQELQQALAAKPTTTLVTVKQPSEDAVDIVLLGTDKRDNQAGPTTTTSTGNAAAGFGRSNTIIVFHVDRSLNFVSVLSIPRDLWVSIPGHGMNRINAA